MNKQNAHQYLPLVQALAEGKTIQIRMNAGWTDIDHPEFQADPERYRIKPEPREFCISLYESGQVYDCKPSDQEIHRMCMGTVIRVREILD